MTTPHARAALVEIAVAALACADLPATHAAFRDVIGRVAEQLAMDAEDSLHPLRNAADAWSADPRAWPRVVAALRDIYVARGGRHLTALGLGPVDG